MTSKLVWLLAVLSLVSCGDVAEPKSDTPVVQEMVPLVKLDESKHIELKPDDAESRMLPPIEPLMPKLPFLFPFGSDSAAPSSDLVVNSNSEQTPKRGVLTILLLKSSKSNQDQAPESSNPAQPSELLDHLILFNFMQSRLSGLFKNQLKQEQPLLGGPSDPDHSHVMHDSDSDSDEDSDSEPRRPPPPPPSSILSFFNFNQQAEQPSIMMRTDDGHPAMLSNDIGYGSAEPTDTAAAKKKCLMLSFMRLKASVYYRTIVHLLFISGLILFALCAFGLCVRVCRRRRACRFYTEQNMRVATIESAVKEKAAKETGSRMFLFRLGSLKGSYAQRPVEDTVMLVGTAPPAYDQLAETRGVSLAAAHKNKYSRLVDESAKTDEDAKSVSSLPGYEEKPEEKI